METFRWKDADLGDLLVTQELIWMCPAPGTVCVIIRSELDISTRGGIFIPLDTPMIFLGIDINSWPYVIHDGRTCALVGDVLSMSGMDPDVFRRVTHVAQ